IYLAVSRTLCRVLSRQTAFQSSTLFATGSTLTHSAYVCPYRAEPKKKKVDPCKEQMVPPELIPLDDFISMHLAGVEARSVPVPHFKFLSTLPLNEQTQHRVEMEAVTYTQ
uniref:Uncharacterized protein n=1 Tax=Salmo trutta TaxID=8032 RepID=A0A674CWU9_SALTR